MKPLHRLKTAFTSVVLAATQFAAAEASATVINFEDVANGTFLSQDASLISQGYRVTESGPSFALIAGPSSTSFSGNGTNRLVAFNQSAIRVASLSNNAFDLFNFAGGESWINQPHLWATQIRAVGVYTGGGSTTQIFNLDLIKNPLTGMQTFALNDTFRQLKSVTFSGVGGNPEFSLDNISISAVPEPASIALLLLGVAGIAASRRKAVK